MIVRLIVILAMLAFAGCDDVTRVPLVPKAIVGTKAVIRAHGKDFTLEVTDVAEKIVISNLSDWNGQLVTQRHYYRGLYPIAGTEGTSQWEVDFDHTLLESLFPLDVGKETGFHGTMKDISKNRTYDFLTQIKIIKEKPFSLPTGTHKVYIIEILTEYKWNGKTERKNEIVYFSPDFSMNLKGILHGDGAQRYWRVVSVERPGQGETIPDPVRQRRSGTVMI